MVATISARTADHSLIRGCCSAVHDGQGGYSGPLGIWISHTLQDAEIFVFVQILGYTMTSVPLFDRMVHDRFGRESVDANLKKPFEPSLYNVGSYRSKQAKCKNDTVSRCS